MVEVKFSKKAKEDCLKGGFPIDYLKKAIQEEMEGKAMYPLINDIIGISVVYGKKPLIAFGRQYEDLLLIDEVAFNVVLVHATEDGDPVVHEHDYIESETYIALKSIEDKEELLLSPIESLDINVRTHQRLWKDGIKTIGDLIGKPEEYYLEKKILPSSYVEELRGRLRALNLGFKREEDH